MQGFDSEIVQFIEAHHLLPPGSRVLVACSGGVDSMVLLHYLIANQKKFHVHVGAVHVDHMLRGESSAEDGVLVRSFCEQRTTPFHRGSVPVPAILNKAGGNVQAICREGRYDYFNEVMARERYDILVTGHHAEDQLETVLMQLTKGISPLGMPIKRSMENGTLIRPLLGLDKATLYQYAREHQILFREDPSNQESHYMRNRFRHHIMPRMIAENPAIMTAITPLTNELQQDDKFLQALTKEQLETHVTLTEGGFPSMRVKTFQHMATALQRRAIPLLLDYLYRDEKEVVFYKKDLIQEVLKHLTSNEGNVTVDLPKGFKFNRAYGQFSFEPKLEVHDKQVTLPQGEIVEWDPHTWFYWEELKNVDQEALFKANEIAFFNLSKASLPLKVRLRQEGDRMMLTGMENAKRLSRLFIDEKINKSLRSQLPIIVTQQDEVCAVPTVRYGRDFTSQKENDSQYIFIKGNK